jgi:hypothetical protein
VEIDVTMFPITLLFKNMSDTAVVMNNAVKSLSHKGGTKKKHTKVADTQNHETHK